LWELLQPVKEAAMPASSRIKHVVIIVKENHTFDNYFGRFPGVKGVKLPDAANPPPDDPDHKHQTWMKRAHESRYKLQYGEHDISTYYSYAHHFTLCDNYFSEVAGPSTPNHLMLICADAPIINNPAHHYRPTPSDVYDLPSLPIRLEKAGQTWGNYGGYAFHYVKELAGHHGNYSADLFIHQAAAGKLPAVSWVYGEGRPSMTEHPPQNITEGMDWTAKQIQAIVAGGLWAHTAIILTYDDWGGWYDHVDPPVVEKWDSAHAQRPVDQNPEFNGQPFRYGSRVPCLVISPYAKAGHISHQLNSHVSVVKLCTTIFGLQSITHRDRDANGLSDCFDFNQRPLKAPQ
jgi:phospholipase C